MVYEKRIVSALVWGVIFGFISWGLVRVSGDVPLSGAVAIILSRTLLGFVIGISAWRIVWWLHGILLGLFFGLPSGFASLWLGRGWGAGFVLTVVTGIIFGFLIELLTTVVFKAELRGAKPEEKKEEEKPAEIPKEAPKPPEEKAKPEEAKVPEVKAPPKPKEKKRKKIRNMNLEEIEKKLKETEERMGGLQSKYAQHLLQRKEELLKEQKKGNTKKTRIGTRKNTN